MVFGALAAVAASFELTKGKTGLSEQASKEFWKFRANYTLVYAVMMGKALIGGFSLNIMSMPNAAVRIRVCAEFLLGSHVR